MYSSPVCEWLLARHAQNPKSLQRVFQDEECISRPLTCPWIIPAAAKQFRYQFTSYRIEMKLLPDQFLTDPAKLLQGRMPVEFVPIPRHPAGVGQKLVDFVAGVAFAIGHGSVGVF